MNICRGPSDYFFVKLFKTLTGHWQWYFSNIKWFFEEFYKRIIGRAPDKCSRYYCADYARTTNNSIWLVRKFITKILLFITQEALKIGIKEENVPVCIKQGLLVNWKKMWVHCKLTTFAGIAKLFTLKWRYEKRFPTKCGAPNNRGNVTSAHLPL